MVFSLDVIWFLVIGFSVMFYIILDGFDLGVGMVHLFAKSDNERRIFLNAIGPVWDGNEVWLVVVGGSLFAGFPEVYATLFSGFYTLCMILLAGLIFRAVAIEFRSKQESKIWRSIWDGIFSIASFVIAFSVGLVMGNIVQGIPLDEHKNFTGTFSDLFSLYPIIAGIASVALLMMHGSIFLVMKTEGVIHDRLRRFINPTLLFFAIAFICLTAATWIYMPHMVDRVMNYPILFAFPLFTLLSIANVPREIHHKNDGRAFLSSCAAIVFLLVILGIGIFPTLVRSTINPDVYSLTVYNSASSPLTLKVLLIIVAIGVPMVLGYGIYIYRVFRGKVRLGPHSY